MRKTKAMKLIEAEKGKSIIEVLNELYARHGNQSEVAEALGIDQSTLSLWLIRLGLQEKRVIVPIQAVGQLESEF